MMEKTLVSICCQTFNHVNYIEQCIEGFLMQKINFKIEILLRDDASSDGTTEIVKKYSNKYPHIINALIYTKNQFQKGVSPFRDNVRRAKGKYIALCEGDDYWTDPYKLQKQVDFLEVNEDYGICAHRVQISNQFNASENYIFPENLLSQDYFIEQFIANNLAATCSIIFKKELFQSNPWHNKSPFGDILLILTVLKNSNNKIRILHDVMGTYRIHYGGIHGKFHQSNEGLVIAYEQHLQFNKLIKRHLLSEDKYKSHIQTKKIDTIQKILSLIDKRKSPFKYVKYKFLNFLKFYLI
jgi:glycosyltransferase involved in cell wall biosynthesis